MRHIKKYLTRNCDSALSIRIGLAILVIGCILPLAAVVAFLIFSFYEKEQTQLLNNAISQAHGMIATVDRDFATTEAALLALRTSSRLTHSDLKSFYPQAVAALQNMHVNSILLIDANGQILLTTRRPFHAPLPKLISPPLLNTTLTTQKPSVSSLFIGPITGNLIFTIAVPVRHEDASLYSLNATVSPAQLADILKAQQFPDSWTVAIIDSNYRVAQRNHDIARFLGKRITEDLFQHLHNVDEDGFKGKTLDNQSVFTAYSRSQTTKWTVVIGIPLNEMTAGLHQTLFWLIIATFTGLIIGLTFAWRIGGNIARSITELIVPTSAIGSSATLMLPRLYFKETKQLGQTLQDASNRLYQAQISLNESNQRLALVLDATQFGIWIRDMMTNEIWGSDQWHTLYGFHEQLKITLADVLQRVHPSDRAAVQQTLDHTRCDTTEYNIEYRIILPDGKIRWIASRGRSELRADGSAFLVRGVSFDITSGKRTKLELQKKRIEITKLSRITMLGELSGALAHELNQPLAAILSNAQAAQRFLAKERIDLNEVRDILQDIVDEDKRAGEIIRRLRSLLTTGKAQPQAVDINKLVSEISALLGNELISQGVELSTECTPDLPALYADPIQLQQVLINLIVNACDAMKVIPALERRIVVRTGYADHAQVLVSVIDQGIGIAVDDLERVFDAFYTTKAHGMGLGLSICHTIIEASGGHLWCANNPERGASFHFCMPRYLVKTS